MRQSSTGIPVARRRIALPRRAPSLKGQKPLGDLVKDRKGVRRASEGLHRRTVCALLGCLRASPYVGETEIETARRKKREGERARVEEREGSRARFDKFRRPVARRSGALGEAAVRIGQSRRAISRSADSASRSLQSVTVRRSARTKGERERERCSFPYEPRRRRTRDRYCRGVAAV